MSLTVVNFAHPLSGEQREAMAAAVGVDAGIDVRVVEVPASFGSERPLVAQAVALVDEAHVSPHDWETESIVVVLPSLAVAAAVVLAELHGRMGRFPAVARFARSEGPLAEYRLAELLDLNEVRAEARGRR